MSEPEDIGPPGHWICSTCGFVLMKMMLRASDMAVGVDAREVQDVCPNDGSSMRRKTWKEDALDADRVGREQMALADELRAKLEAAEQERDKLKEVPVWMRKKLFRCRVCGETSETSSYNVGCIHGLSKIETWFAGDGEAMPEASRGEVVTRGETRAEFERDRFGETGDKLSERGEVVTACPQCGWKGQA